MNKCPTCGQNVTSTGPMELKYISAVRTIRTPDGKINRICGICLAFNKALENPETTCTHGQIS
jgi:hypothetical protein